MGPRGSLLQLLIASPRLGFLPFHDPAAIIHHSQDNNSLVPKCAIMLSFPSLSLVQSSVLLHLVVTLGYPLGFTWTFAQTSTTTSGIWLTCEYYSWEWNYDGPMALPKFVLQGKHGHMAVTDRSRYYFHDEGGGIQIHQTHGHSSSQVLI